MDMTERAIVELVSFHGEVCTIKIVRDKKTKICKGYAFLEMKDQAAAENVVQVLDGTPIGDRMLSVKIREEAATPVAPPKFSKPSYSSNNRFTPKFNSTPDPVKKKRPRKLI